MHVIVTGILFAWSKATYFGYEIKRVHTLLRVVYQYSVACSFAFSEGTRLNRATARNLCSNVQWRMFADVINDIGLTLELVSPLFPTYFIYIACAGTICKTLCGIAAGSTRSAISAHFAKRDNLAGW